MVSQTGVGKSILSGQFALHAMEQGYKSLIISLEMLVEETWVRMATQRSLVPAGMDEVLDFSRWANDKLWFYNQNGTINFAALLAVVRYSVANFGIKFIVVDSLMTMGDIPSDDYQGQRRLMLALSIAARDMGIHIMLIAHARKGLSVEDKLDLYSVSGSADLTNLASSVILLNKTPQSRKDRDATAPDITFEIAKARHFDTTDTTLDLWFDTASYNYQTKWDTPRIIGEKDENTVSESEGTEAPAMGEITIVGGTGSKASRRGVKVNGGSGGRPDAVASG
jgi:twinkle protein